MPKNEALIHVSQVTAISCMIIHLSSLPEPRRKNNKKFDYQSKTNKIPLRDKIRQEEVEKEYEELEKEARRKANRMLAERRRKEEAMKQSKKINGILKKTGKQSDYVTLTQDQLESILASLSQVQGSSKTGNVHVEIGEFKHTNNTYNGI